MKTHTHLTPWKRPSNYAGATWFDYYPLAGRSRDSSAIEESNFRSFEKALRAKVAELGCAEIATPDVDNELATVETERSSHWAVGWVETLLVHQRAPVALLDWCEAQLERLDGYPVFDEEDFSELETEQANDVWKCFRVSDRVEYIREHSSEFEFRSLGDMLGCVRGNYFAGYASELLNS